MRVGPFHLTYCTNIHAGERWPDVLASLQVVLPKIRRHLSWTEPFAVGLRLSAAAAAELSNESVLQSFKAYLRDGNYYVFTINGFPYGAFHGERVKEQVYLPDWRDSRRIDYSNQLASILAALLPEEIGVGSVSTVPGAFKSHARTAADAEMAGAGIRQHATFLRDLESRTGRRIRLALEPEPACLLETVEDTCNFFDRFLNDKETRQYVGACVDTCHMAVEFEDASTVNRRLLAAGVDVVKVQISSALRLPPADAASLEPFADDVYLHQVVARQHDSLSRFVDLPDAMNACPGGDEWRVHFHVPLFLEQLGALGTTQAFVSEYLAELRRSPVCDALEVETYTWDVLPAEHRVGDVSDAIARELRWVRTEIA